MGFKRAFRSVAKIVNKVDNALGDRLIPDAEQPSAPTAEETALMKALQEEEAAFKRQVAEYSSQEQNLQAELAKAQEEAAAQGQKLKSESEVIQRESAERRLARLRARKRSTSRPMLASAGINMKGEA